MSALVPLFTYRQKVFLAPKAKELYGLNARLDRRTACGRVEQPQPLDDGRILVYWPSNEEPSLVPQNELVGSRPVFMQDTAKVRVGSTVRISRRSLLGGSRTDYELPPDVKPNDARGTVMFIWRGGKMMDIHWNDWDAANADKIKTLHGLDLSVMINDRVVPDYGNDDDE